MSQSTAADTPRHRTEQRTHVFRLRSGQFGLVSTGDRRFVGRQSIPVSADLAAELSARFAPSVLYGVPTFFARIVETCSPDSFGSLRCVVSAGEALRLGLAERLAEFFGGIPILDGIGSTEVGQTFVSNRVDEWRPGTLGKVLEPYEIRVVASDGATVRPGAEGDLWVRGPSIAAGYWNRPVDPLTDGEWLNTRDRVCIDGDGWVTYCCRADDIEIIGGVNVNPGEVERLIIEDDDVAEAAVVSVRDARRSVGVAGVSRPGERPAVEQSVIRDIHRRLLTQLSAFKVPHRFASSNNFPEPRTENCCEPRFARRARQSQFGTSRRRAPSAGHAEADSAPTSSCQSDIRAA